MEGASIDEGQVNGRAPPLEWRPPNPRRSRRRGASATHSFARGGARLELFEARPLRRRAVGAAELARVARGQVGEELAVRGLVELLGDGAAGDLDHLVSAAGGSSGWGPSPRGRRRSAGSGRPRCRAARSFLASLPSRRPEARSHRQVEPLARVERPDRVQGGGRVEADDEVEVLVAEQVEVRGRVDAAVDVAAPADLTGW